MPPCFCGSSGAVSSEAVNLLPPTSPHQTSQSASPAAASVASTQQPVYGTLRTSSGRRARTGLYPPSLYILSVWLLLLLSLLLFNFRPEELFWIVFSFRNFHLWFANMGSSCGFSRGNIVALFLLLLLEGKVHHQFSCHWKRVKEHTMKLQTNAKCCTSVSERFWKQNKCSGLNY